MTSRWAIALLDRPSAISVRTWRSRSASLATCGWPERLARSLSDDLGVHDGAAAGNRAQRVGELLVGEDPVLEQVADSARLVGEQLPGIQPLDMRREDQDGQPRHLAPDLQCRAQALIRIGRGGSRTSTIATSGRCPVSARSSEGPLPGILRPQPR